jgi:hypothetical protein
MPRAGSGRMIQAVPDAPASRSPFTRTYLGLRRELAAARLLAGSRIRIDETARAFRISPTPVREALARLAGERLVRGSRRDGYFVPLYSAGDLQQLYRLAELHIQMAIATCRQGRAWRVVPPGFDQADAESLTSLRLLILLLSAAGQPILKDAGLLAVERLAPARPGEASVLNAAEEAVAMKQAACSGSPSHLARAVRSYFRVRRARSADIAAMMGAGPASDVEYSPDID